MLKRFVPLLVVAIILVAAPAALADHCVRCSFPQPPSSSTHCVWGSVLGRTDCDTIDNICETFGNMCSHYNAAATLASDYQVASVERIDEAPQPDASLVATLDAPKPAAETR